MKHFLSFTVLLAGCASATIGGSATDADLVITRVSVVDVEKGSLTPGQDVLIKGNRIIGLAPQGRKRLRGRASGGDGATTQLCGGGGTTGGGGGSALTP